MNITKLTERFIENHPSVKDCVKGKLINYSKLSRKIMSEHNLRRSDFDAVLIACRRYFWKVSKGSSNEDAVVQMLLQSKVEAKNQVAVAVIDKDIYTEDLLGLEKKAKKNDDIFYAIEGTKSITLVISAGLIEEVKSSFKSSVKKLWKDLALVIIKSPEGKQDTTPGFLAFLSGKISYRGINILEFMSCWSETLFVVAEKDIAGVMDALKC
ncbi:hypothetical protein HYX10_01370 [Candidatus Woesearchaeota archaeon]|nr:hypothetical protein [Candidatus Woesearchaeota archaeon]